MYCDEQYVFDVLVLSGANTSIDLAACFPEAILFAFTLVTSQAPLGGLPPSKYQFKHWSGFLKDSNSLASYNIAPGEVIELHLRTRGGRR